MNYRWGLISAALIGALAGPAQAQTRAISGTVTDSGSGGPLSGALVTIPGTRIGTYAKDNGRFVITDGPEGEVTLLVRLVGYRKREVTVGAGEASVEVVLTRDILRLEEIVVTGQATGVERRNAANAVATITASDLASVPTPSVEQQLQGKVAGADIQTNQGSPGGGVQVRLRGVSSINAPASPLYVVDGVIVSDVAIPNNQDVVTLSTGGSNKSILQQGQVNRIADLSPGDIESIEILKGASASAIYGGRASNGVVIIATKRGRVGAPQVNVTQRFGFFGLSNKLGSRRFDSTAAVGVLGASAAPYFANGARPFFDHEQELSGRKALSYETSASISGGDDNTRYFASGITKNDEGVVQNTGFQRQGVRVNLEQRLSSRVHSSVSTNVIHTLAQRGLTGNDNSNTSYYLALAFTPSFLDLKADPTGAFPDNPFYGSTNALQTAGLSKNDEDVWRFLGSSRLQWDVAQTGSHYFRVIADGGLDFFTQENSLLFPSELQFERTAAEPGVALLSNTNNLNLNLNGNLVHTYTPASHRFSATTSAGIQYARRKLNTSRIVGKGLIGGQSNV
ncbi:MAG: carboxypeptidase-like regulatory domain-containing protein, partial [Gemmatimonadales bacterium]